MLYDCKKLKSFFKNYKTKDKKEEIEFFKVEKTVKLTTTFQSELTIDFGAN